jgi:hypothetical protein
MKHLELEIQSQILMNIFKSKGPELDRCETADLRKGTRNMNRQLSTGKIAVKPIDVTRGEFEVSKLMKE